MNPNFKALITLIIDRLRTPFRLTAQRLNVRLRAKFWQNTSGWQRLCYCTSCRDTHSPSHFHQSHRPQLWSHIQGSNLSHSSDCAVYGPRGWMCLWSVSIRRQWYVDSLFTDTFGCHAYLLTLCILLGSQGSPMPKGNVPELLWGTGVASKWFVFLYSESY